jgi:UDP-N-acetylmuramoyl-tripeptide--D-alanyl-D-alanine ligase
MKKIFKKIIIAILTAEAKMALYRWDPKIIAVTGNVGKTSTKDAIYTIFSKLSTVQKSEKSFNSDIGVPLTILGLKNAWSNPILWTINIIIGLLTAIFKKRNEKWLILEIGADRPNDIKNITKWIKPDIAVINKIGETPVHVEYFGSAEAGKRKIFFSQSSQAKWRFGCIRR